MPLSIDTIDISRYFAFFLRINSGHKGCKIRKSVCFYRKR
ncbi:hypothetical protein HMPREF3218_0200629 [Prevotella bivia]|nr:hypothetical protein HMPREF3218_0200629 [Prevotella bivia]